MKTQKNGQVVMIAEAEIDASNILWVGDQWVKPRVICKVFARFREGEVEAIRRRRKEKVARDKSPILFSSL